jgi:LmbE family N-acetylglucosaminyl deacetylase
VKRLALALALFFAPRVLAAQERGAIALGEAVQALGVTTRVLVIGAHPDDEDTFLISWLSRGRSVETAYLSLTRGDGGQNLIGNELGERLGVIRTEELLAARRVDGALQFFTRAYDFGFSKDTIDTYAHWPRDSVLADVIRVVRAFRPHVIVAVFTGTPRDGHGHHQVSALLARTAYDAAGDTSRYPIASHGPPWTPLKFYRAARYVPETATLRFDVGEYSPLLGRSYAEIAGESRSQHKSQGFGAAQRKGAVIDMVAREASRVNASVPATSEQSIFDGIDTTWARFRGATSGIERAWLDSLPRAFAAARAAFDPMHPERLLDAVGQAQGIVDRWRSMNRVTDSDIAETLSITGDRIARALQLASGVEAEAFADHEMYPVGRTARVVVSVYNRGNVAVTLAPPRTTTDARPSAAGARTLAPGTAVQDTLDVSIDSVSQPWWLASPRLGAMFTQPVSRTSATRLRAGPALEVTFRTPSTGPTTFMTPVVFREVDPVKGEIRRNVAGVPAVAVSVEQETQFAPANTEFGREFNVRVRSADERARDVRVRLTLPPGLSADSAQRATRLTGYDAAQTLTFRLRGRLTPGSHVISAIAESDGERFTNGYQLIDYEHIRRQRVYRPATSTISAVAMRVPATLRVAYVTGVGDNVAPTLAQLGIPVTVMSANDIAHTDLSPYTTVVIGPRAYEAHPELRAANPHLFDFVKAGGTMLVQYGQVEMTEPGVMPYAVTLARPADRVTEEDAPVVIDAPNDQLLQSPNRIGGADFTGWVQERALYMPRTFDEHYRSLLSMHDRGESPNRAAILVAPLGRGTYIYTTLSFFRQLPAGVPGPARLFLDLLSANVSPAVNP